MLTGWVALNHGKVEGEKPWDGEECLTKFMNKILKWRIEGDFFHSVKDTIKQIYD